MEPELQNFITLFTKPDVFLGSVKSDERLVFLDLSNGWKHGKEFTKDEFQAHVIEKYGSDLTAFEGYCEEFNDSDDSDTDDSNQLETIVRKHLTDEQLSVFDMFVPLMEWIINPIPGCNVYLKDFDFDEYDPIIAWTAIPHRQDEAYVLAHIKEFKIEDLSSEFKNFIALFTEPNVFLGSIKSDEKLVFMSRVQDGWKHVDGEEFVKADFQTHLIKKYWKEDDFGWFEFCYNKKVITTVKKILTDKQLYLFDMFVPLMKWIINPTPGCNVYLEDFDFDKYDPIIAWTAVPHRQDEAYVLARVKKSASK